MNVDNIKSEHIRELLNREFEVGNKLWFANIDNTELHLTKELLQRLKARF